VFVHHDLNAWIFVCLKFECLKNEFEKEISKRKKKETLFFPPSLSHFSRQPSFSPQAFSFSSRAQTAQVGPICHPAGPAPPPLPFLLRRG
jgi:hypothetical protein